MYVCACCKGEVFRGDRVDLTLARDLAANHQSGRYVTSACAACADAVADGLYRVARLWVPSAACPHTTGTLDLGLFDAR